MSQPNRISKIQSIARDQTTLIHLTCQVRILLDNSFAGNSNYFADSLKRKVTAKNLSSAYTILFNWFLVLTYI